MPLLLGILKKEQPESALIFCNTKKMTEIVARRLQINGIDCQFIIGDMQQTKRLKVIDDLKAGKIKTLVATDVAARGLDIESLAMVINYDLPVEAENYVHRIGRTARAGKTGKTIALASEQDVYELPAIERYIGKKIPSEIAAQDYYEKDKSAGQRIETDFYEERHHGTPYGTTKSTGKKHDSRKTADERPKTKERKKHKPETSDSKKTGIKHEPAALAAQDLSHLSMEDRMALYKKKYAGEKHAENKKHERRKPSHHHAQKPVAQPTSQIQEEKIAQEQTVPEKKGLISKFIGLFRKK
jgi:ATP-dependent RNA helicase RhlB